MGLLCLFLFGCTKEQIQVDAYGNIEGAEVKAVSMEESAETLSQTGEEANKNSQYPEKAEQDSIRKNRMQNAEANEFFYSNTRTRRLSNARGRKK